MSGWTTVTQGNITMDHQSTSSQVILTIKDPPDEPREIYLDYAEFYDMMNCMKQIDEHLTG